MKLFSIEMSILNLLQERLDRRNDIYWEIERYKNAFNKVEEFYDWSKTYIKEITK